MNSEIDKQSMRIVFCRGKVSVGALTLSAEKKDPMLKKYLTTEILPAAAAKWSAVRPSWGSRDGVCWIKILSRDYVRGIKVNSSDLACESFECSAVTFLCCSVFEPLLTRKITASMFPACAAYIRAVDPS